MRSSNGWERSWAWASTRRLNSSQLSSLLMYSAGALRSAGSSRDQSIAGPGWLVSASAARRRRVRRPLRLAAFSGAATYVAYQTVVMDRSSSGITIYQSASPCEIPLGLRSSGGIVPSSGDTP